MTQKHGWLQGNGLHAALPLTCRQCSIHYKSNCVAPGISKQKWVPRNTCMKLPKGI